MPDISLKSPRQNRSHLVTLLGFIAIFAILAVIAGLIYWFIQKAPEDKTPVVTCEYAGQSYKPGASFRSSDGCNTCGCSEDGQVACTEMACADTPPATTTAPTVTPAENSDPTTPTPTMPESVETGLKVYFGKPAAENDYETLVAINRPTDATDTAQFTFVITQLINGPSAEEKAAGAVGILTLSGASSCGGSSFQFSRSNELLTVRICKPFAMVQNSGTGGAYAGMSLAGNKRIIKAFGESLQLNGVTKIALRNPDNSCFAKDTGLNTACVD